MEFTSKDIFTNSFVALQGSANNSNVIEILVSLLMSFAIGTFIFFVYKKTFQGVLYQRSFNVSLVIITMVLTLIIMIIKGNLVLSLGMVGALSIVRFRTPVKDPVDLVFIFWAISVGIANGVGFYHISIIGSVCITLALLVMSKKAISNDAPYLLIIKTDKNNKLGDKISSKVNELVQTNYLKSKTITADYCEIIYEVRVSDNNTDFMQQLDKENYIQQATLITYTGDLAAVS